MGKLCLWEKKPHFVISDPLPPLHTHTKKNLYLGQLKNNQNQMNTTGGQNLKEFNIASDQMSCKPSRKLTFVFLFGSILLLTLSDLAYACTGSACR